MTAQFLAWLTRAIVSAVVLSTLWLAHATDRVERRPSLLVADGGGSVTVLAPMAEAAAIPQR